LKKVGGNLCIGAGVSIWRKDLEFAGNRDLIDINGLFNIEQIYSYLSIEDNVSLTYAKARELVKIS
jgi:hypothetical protein